MGLADVGVPVDTSRNRRYHEVTTKQPRSHHKLTTNTPQTHYKPVTKQPLYFRSNIMYIMSELALYPTNPLYTLLPTNTIA